jgi:hypothetical protein
MKLESSDVPGDRAGVGARPPRAGRGRCFRPSPPSFSFATALGLMARGFGYHVAFSELILINSDLFVSRVES